MKCSISKDWTFRGIETVILESPKLRVVVLSGKGADISEIFYKPLQMNLLFRNPWGPRSPFLFPPVSPHSQMFRDYTGGGLSDILPNAGDASTYKGVVFGLHDETPLLKWSSEIIEDSESRVSAKFRVKLNKFPFEVEKSVNIDSNDLIRIRERVTNESKQELPFSWLIHPTFSPDFVGPNSEIELNAKSIYRVGKTIEEWEFPNFEDVDGVVRDVRKIPGSDLVMDNTLVFGPLNEGKYSITNSRLGLSLDLTWPKEIFKYVWYYRSLHSQDYPYYGRSWFVALEPSSSLRSGLASQAAAQDVLVLGPDKSIEADFEVRVSQLK